MNSPAACSTLPLWRRLACRQPYFSHGAVVTPSHSPTPHAEDGAASTEEETRGHETPGAFPDFAFSCVVVPPPVPAATDAFQSHVHALVEGLSPEFITVTSYTPFFVLEEDEDRALCDDVVSASQEPSSATSGSSTQQALRFLQGLREQPIPLVLTVTATRATCAVPYRHRSALDVDTTNHEGTHTTTTTTTSTPCPAATSGPVASLTGASRKGVTAIVRRFYQMLCAPPMPPSTPPDSNPTEATAAIVKGEKNVAVGGLMVLRGDDNGYTRTACLARQASRHAPSGLNPYKDFADGAALLYGCHDTLLALSEKEIQTASAPAATDRISLFTGGYPQGHCMAKYWHPEGTPSLPAQADSTTTASASADAVAAEDMEKQQQQQQRSYAFLEALDQVLAETNIPRRRSRPHDPRHSRKETNNNETASADDAETEGTEPPLLPTLHAQIEESLDTLEKLIKRARDGACRLCTTPYTFNASPCAATAPTATREKGAEPRINPPNKTTEEEERLAYRQHIRDTLVRHKLCDTQRGAATVVVTQMISSAEEFFTYADAVYAELAHAAAEAPQDGVEHGEGGETGKGKETTAAAVVVPGVMAPLPAEEYTRAVLQQKVVPSPPLYAALLVYVDGLTKLKERLCQLQAELHHLQGNSPEREASAWWQQAQRLLAQMETERQALEAAFESTMEEDVVRVCTELAQRGGYRHVNISCFSYHGAPAVLRVVQRLRKLSETSGEW